jgi:membrane-bound lytic murein transglycosylase D
MTHRWILRLALAAAVIGAGLLPAPSRAADPAGAVRDSVAAPAARPTAVPDKEPEPAPEPVADTALLEQVALDDIELQMNSDVLKWIEFFTGNGRSTFERWMQRSGRYMELFRSVLQREGLPPDLVHLVYVESGFNLQARSVAAAVGPWQFISGTSKLFGLNVNQWVDERKDPEKSTVAAARYLKHLFGIFGDWPLALAAYNAGEGRVLRAIKAQGTNNYWDLRLPRETEQYVPKFMAALAISRDPVRYGFSEVELDDPMRFDEVAFKGAVDLRTVAKLAECSIEELRALNPAFRGTTARGPSGVTTLRVPVGRSEVLYANVQQGSPLPAADLTVRHRVQRGETLKGIAREYSVSATALARANRITKARPLKRGMLLTIPASMQAPTPEVLDPAVDPRASTAYVPQRRIGLPARVQGDSRPLERTNHTVRRGETLAGIAAQYGVTPTDLVAWNALRAERVRPGQRLRIKAVAGPQLPDSVLAAMAAEGGAVLASPRPAPPRTHVVGRGETLTSIAARHGVTVSELRQWNGIRSTRGTVQRGQKLVVRATGAAVAHRETPADPDAPAVEPRTGRAAAVTHTVRRGETLSQIARRHGVSVQALREANGLRSANDIKVGQRLKLKV